MEYRCEATSVAGFVQQLSVAYIGRGYFFYVVGEIPEGKDPHSVDQKLIQQYSSSLMLCCGLALSRLKEMEL